MAVWINGTKFKVPQARWLGPGEVRQEEVLQEMTMEEALQEVTEHYTDHDVEDIARGLEAIVRIQHRSAMALPERSRAFPSPQVELVTAAYCLQREVGELVDEFPWKPWRAYGSGDNGVTAHLVGDEFADVLHFMAWLVRTMHQFNPSITPHELARAFVAKAHENDRRFAGKVPGREPPAGTS